MCFVQAATLLSTKQLKCFNDDHYLPQDAREVLNTIQKKYGKDIFCLLSVMVSYDDEKRSNLEDIKNKEFRNFRDSNDPEYHSGSDLSNKSTIPNISPGTSTLHLQSQSHNVINTIVKKTNHL